MTDTISTDISVYEETIKNLEKASSMLQRQMAMYRDWHNAAGKRIKELEAALIGDIDAGLTTTVQAHLQSKMMRQKAALNTLNKRVRGQRLHLRTINELGRGLTAEEWIAAKAKYPEELEETIPEY